MNKSKRNKRIHLGFLALCLSFFAVGCEMPHQTGGNVIQAKIKADAEKDKAKRDSRTKIALQQQQQAFELQTLQMEQDQERARWEHERNLEQERHERAEEAYENGYLAVGDAQGGEDGVPTGDFYGSSV